MALLYTGHGLVWKSQGCSGSGEHDPFASELVDLALPIERAAQPAVQNGAHRAFNRFEDWRCEACGWNANALYTQWTTTAANGDPFRPLDVINDHRTRHERAQQGLDQPLPESQDLKLHAAQVRLEANTRIAERLEACTTAGLLSEEAETRYQTELTTPTPIPA